MVTWLCIYVCNYHRFLIFSPKIVSLPYLWWSQLQTYKDILNTNNTLLPFNLYSCVSPWAPDHARQAWLQKHPKRRRHHSIADLRARPFCHICCVQIIQGATSHQENSVLMLSYNSMWFFGLNLNPHCSKRRGRKNASQLCTAERTGIRIYTSYFASIYILYIDVYIIHILYIIQIDIYIYNASIHARIKCKRDQSTAPAPAHPFLFLFR